MAVISDEGELVRTYKTPDYVNAVEGNLVGGNLRDSYPDYIWEKFQKAISDISSLGLEKYHTDFTLRVGGMVFQRHVDVKPTQNPRLFITMIKPTNNFPLSQPYLRLLSDSKKFLKNS